MKQVIDWVKTNILTVLSVVVMIAAGVGLPMMAASQNADLRDEVQSRASELTRIRNLERSSLSFSVAGQTIFEHSGIAINRALLDEFERIVNGIQEDAANIRQFVLEFNHQGRTPLLDTVFPSPPERRERAEMRQFYRQLTPAYESVLARIGAGMPPAGDALRDEMERAQEAFIWHILQRNDIESLNNEERQKLREEMTQRRMSEYGKRARAIKVYADLASLQIPNWPEVEERSMAEVFQWQWNYWIQEDVLEAVARANEDAGSVIDAPVKHVVSIRVLDPLPNTGGSSGRSGPSRTSGTGSSGQGSSGGSGGGGQAAVGGSADPKAEIRPNFNASFTGRTSNGVYDVRRAEVHLVADTTRLLEIFESLAEQNFMTVLDASVRTADPFEAMQSGFYYGSGAVSDVTLLIETIWLREWTAQYMPPSVREALGVPAAAASSN